ncbi:MAG TPA: hypothetical protein PLN21_08330 [Gemmatales bacterium]|nr:hypothetical protein [Gemmatales bacterium]
MSAVAEYAGFLAAHNIERVSQGNEVVPMLAYEGSDGMREVVKLPEPLDKGLAMGTKWLHSNPENANHAVIVFNGSVVLDDKDVDAVICKAVQYQPEPVSFKVAVPYSRTENPPEFKVYRIKLLDYEGSESEPQFDPLVHAFFEGVEKNEDGADVWFNNMDQSK